MLGDVPVLLMAHWTVTSLYDHIYSILQRNDVPWQRKLPNKWTHKFVTCALTWKKMLEEEGATDTPAEWLSQLISALPFDQLPLGSKMSVDEWSRAHAPSVVVALYRGIPGEYRSHSGERLCLKSTKDLSSKGCGKNQRRK